MGEFSFGQSVQTLLKNEGKVLLDEIYFEESNINRKPLIWSKDKIITKFRQKNESIWFWAKCLKTTRELRKNVILRNSLRRG